MSELYKITGIRGGAPKEPDGKASYLWQSMPGEEFYVIPGQPIALILSNYIEETVPHDLLISQRVIITLKRMRDIEDDRAKPVLLSIAVNQSELYCRPFLEYKEV